MENRTRSSLSNIGKVASVVGIMFLISPPEKKLNS